MQFPDLADVQRRRKLIGMTQTQFAKQAGISQSLLTKIERGIVVPNYKIAMDLFNVLEIAENKDQKLAKDAMHAHVITIRPSDTVEKAAVLVKKHAISQLPIVEGHRLVGSIAAFDLIGKQKGTQLRDILAEPFPTVSENTPITTVKELLKGVRAVIVVRKDAIVGIITPENLL